MKRAHVHSCLKFSGAMLLALALGLMIPLASRAASDGMMLTGTVKSVAGAKMGGVAVSAKMDNSTITTSVFTEDDGNYYFPPMASGHYEVWAQADGFETARGDVTLAATKHQDFVLNPAKDFVRQLSGDQILASLPDQTPDDRDSRNDEAGQRIRRLSG